MCNKLLKRIFAITPLAALFLCVILSVNNVSAYLTDIGNTLENNFTIALGVSHVIVEKFPLPNDDGLASSTPSFDISESGTSAKFEKAVQVANTGYVDEYVRVKLEFTDSAIMNNTKFSSDGTNYYSANPSGSGDLYINHLPDGWVYNSSDGFYYYTKIVESGDWDNFERSLVYDEGQFRYFYPLGANIAENSMITTPLIRYVDNLFAQPKDMNSYGIIVVAQSCPFYGGSNYSEAWANYDPTNG